MEENKQIEIETNEVVEKVEEPKKEVKLLPTSFLVIAIIFILIAFVISWVVGIKQRPVDEEQQPEVKEEVENKPIKDEEIKLNIDEAKGIEFSDRLDYILQNVFDDYNHLVPDDKRSSTDILIDEVTKFKFVYYIVESYGLNESKIYNVDENGNEVTGMYAVKYDYFKTYYKELIGTDFNQEVLNKVSNKFKLNGEYLYSSVLTGAKSNYQVTTESFTQKGDKYYYTLVVNELDENEKVSLTYRIKLIFSIVNNKYVINSVVVY